MNALRDEFEACRRMTYIDVAARAPLGTRVRRAVDRYLDECAAEGADKPAWFARVELVRAATARLIGADPTEVAFMKNTSDGINTIATSLQLQRGDNVVVCPEFEHANNVYPWLHLRRGGVEVRVEAMQDGRVDPARVASRIDERTRVVTVSSVSSMTGGRTDLAALAAICRPRDIFLLVDAAQSLGVVETDVEALGVDAIASGTQKGLLALYGLGLLYCRRAWLERLQPPFLSVSSVTRLGVHESDLGDLDAYRSHDSAARFETGNPNFAGIFALEAALTFFSDLGPDRVERHVVDQASSLMRQLADRGIRVVTPRGDGQHAGIVVFDVPDAESVAERLEQAGVRISLRRGLLRASFHIYNDEDDIQRLLAALPAG